VLAWAVLGLRATAAVVVLTTLAGGVPRVVQGGLAITFGAWTAIVLGPPVAGADLALAVSEVAFGAALGLVAAVPLVAARTAGALVDATGPGKPYAPLFGVLAAAVFVGIDGHVAMVTAIVESRTVGQGTVIDALAALVPAAVRLALPWLITAAVVQIAVGVGVRVAGRAAAHAPAAAAVPAALVMMTASLVGVLAVGIAALIR
jgi:type III secretion protein T